MRQYHRRIFSSDGWAVMQGGGDFWIAWYSFTSCSLSACGLKKAAIDSSNKEKHDLSARILTLLLLVFVAIARQFFVCCQYELNERMAFRRANPLLLFLCLFSFFIETFSSTSGNAESHRRTRRRMDPTDLSRTCLGAIMTFSFLRIYSKQLEISLKIRVFQTPLYIQCPRPILLFLPLILFLLHLYPFEAQVSQRISLHKPSTISLVECHTNRSIRHFKYLFDSSRHLELSFCAAFIHSKYICMGIVHSPSWSRGNAPF